MAITRREKAGMPARDWAARTESPCFSRSRLEAKSESQTIKATQRKDGERRYLLRRSWLYGSGVGSGSGLGARAEDFHGAFEQALKFGAFDPWNGRSDTLVLRGHDGGLWFCLKTGLGLIHRKTPCKRIAQLGVVSGRAKSFQQLHVEEPFRLLPRLRAADSNFA